MTTQTYFGLENNENSWLLVQRSDGKTVFLRQFKNTLEGLNELARFIKNCCEKPKITIKSTGYTALGLLKTLCGIPDVEVMFVSPAGFKQYQSCLPKKNVSCPAEMAFREAEVLGDYAERMI
jgi:hypothetical protein